MQNCIYTQFWDSDNYAFVCSHFFLNIVQYLSYFISMLKIIAICLVTFLVIVYWLRNAKQVNEIVADPLTTRIYRLEKKLNETAVKHEFDNIVEHNNDMISLKSDSFEALKDEKSVKKFQEEKRRKEDYEFSNVLKDSQMTNLIKINLTMRTLLTNIDEFILNETKRIKKEQQYYILINFIDNHYIIIFGYILGNYCQIT